MHDWYTNGNVRVSAAQKTYLDSYITAQSQVRNIDQNTLAMLNAIGTTGSTSNSDQVTAAIALVLMGVSPVIAVHFPFGGDNHSDNNFTNEATQTVSGMAAIVDLLSRLPMAVNGVAELADRVTYINLNVFGRTMDVEEHGRTKP